MDNVIDQQPRKRPGRPRKIVENNNVDIRGVLAEPNDRENILELCYNNPMIFRKLFTLIKSYQSDEITLQFTRTSFTISCKNHHDTVNIIVSININRLCSYYCGADLTITLHIAEVEKIMSSVEKNQNKMIFIVRRGQERSFFNIVITNSEFNTEDYYELKIIHKDFTQFKQFNEQEYPLQFNISSKFLKKKINDISRISTNITIQKVDGEDLTIASEGERKQISYNGFYKDFRKINLVNNIPPNTLFCVRVHVDNLRPFTNSMIGETIYIYAHMFNDLCMVTHLDIKDNNYLGQVKIYSNIIRDNRVNAAEQAK